MEKQTTTTTTPNPKKAADELQAAGEVGRKAMLASVEATAEMSAQFDRLIRAQLGYLTAAHKDSADYVAHACDGAIKAREAFRRAGVEMVEKTFSMASTRS